MQGCFCLIRFWRRLLVNTTWVQCSFQTQTTQLCKHIPELNNKAAKHMSTDACVHMELKKVCTNCGQIHRPEEHQHSQTHSYMQARREVWGAGQGCEKLLFEKTPHKANKGLTRQMLVMLSGAALLASPERVNKKQAWSDQMDLQLIRREGGWQGKNGGLRMRVEGQTGGWGGAKSSWKETEQKGRWKGWIMAGQRMACGALRRYL